MAAIIQGTLKAIFTCGVASIEQNISQLNLNLNLTNGQKRKVLKRVKELSEKKEIITREDLPFIIAEIIGNNYEKNLK